MKGFFDKVPVDLEEAAYMDGCGMWRTFLRITVPLVKPGIGATAISSGVIGVSVSAAPHRSRFPFLRTRPLTLVSSA
jgi:ABC-type spermidine/putrescine transport system permease subunit I